MRTWEKEMFIFYFPHPFAQEVNKSPTVSIFIHTRKDL